MKPAPLKKLESILLNVSKLYEGSHKVSPAI